MVLVKNLPTSTINTLSNYGGEILYNSSINHPIVNITSGFNKFVLSTLDDNITGIASLTATNLTGTLQTAAQPNVTSLGTLTGLTTNGSLTIAEHDGSTTGLILGSTLVTATGTELNYVDTTPGTAEPNKALITDSNNSIVGLTNLETDNLTVNGTLVTASAVELNYTDVTTVGVAQANKALVVDSNLDIVGIHNLETDNLTVNGTLVTASAIELNYTDVSTIGIADPAKALVLDANRDISNIRNLSADNLTGTLQTAAQPNITSVGTLTNLDIAGSLTVSGIEIAGVSLTPADVGGLRTRVFSTPDFNGRIITNDIITTIDYTDYAPNGQTDNYSMEIWGYIKPLYTEAYTFFITANDHFRLWINNDLITNEWTNGTHTAIQTSPINLVADTWYPIYIQHRQDTSTERLLLIWQSNSQLSGPIPATSFAYDNHEVSVNTRKTFIEDRLVLYDNLNATQTFLFVNNDGDLNISSYSSNVDIIGHDGSSIGLKLNNVLVTATANELNYTDTTPGIIEANKALIVDGNRDIININNIESTGSIYIDNDLSTYGLTDSSSSTTGSVTISGGVGIAKKLYVGDELHVTSNTTLGANLSVTGPILALPVGNTAARPSTPQVGYVRYNSQTSQFEGFGAGASWGSLGGVSDVNQDTKILAEDGAGTNDDNLRFFNNGSETMRLTALGKLGLGTNAPDKQMEINSSTGDCLRLTYNDNNGSAINYVDFNINSSGELILNSSGDNIFIHSTDNFDILGHNGSTLGLKLGGVLVTATADELNYTDTTPGTIEASKALIVDSSRDITNINNITSTGNIQTIGTVYVNNSTDSTSTSTGALIVNGGVGILEDVNIGGYIQLGGNLNMVGDMDIGGFLQVNDFLTVSSYLEIGGQSTFTGSMTINNTLNITNVTDAIDSISGSVIIAGGVGIAKKLYVGDELHVTNDTILGANLSVTGPILALPVGDIASRPSTPQVGYVRYNSQTSQFEGFGAGASWGSLGGVSDVNQDTKILAEDGAGTNDDNLRFFNNGSETMRLTVLGKLGLGTNAPDKQMEINSSTGDCLRLTYNDNNGTADYFADFTIDASGNLSLDASGNNIYISSDNLDITAHDGSTIGLFLNGILVTSTADELNYNDTTQGIAEASKALIMDSNRDISNINQINTKYLTASIDNSTGNSVTYPIILNRNTSGTPATGLGSGIQYYIENSNNSLVAFGSLDISASTITDTNEKGTFKVNLIDNGTMITALTLNKETLTVEELVETSDARVKENIVNADINESYEKIMALNLVDYNFIHDEDKKIHRGLIAQDLKQIIPNAVHINENNGFTDFHSVSSKELIGYMIGALQAMNKKYENLEKKYNDLLEKCNNCN